eukprot:TRINITY_DN33001_c0_g1_i1.p1 TRINITY_DN33001_c0_g1~~TRINITY_DN33001_c0_g1_i1.p1  ORF type:complete len:255 (-),score=35.91 TRINITY_DN33001_c0_g1_i1:188-952(-)
MPKLHVSVPPSLLKTLFVVSVTLPILTTLAAYVVAIPRLSLPVVQPSEAFKSGLGRMLATGGFATAAIPGCMHGLLRYLALTALASPDRLLMRLSEFGCAAMLIEVWSLIGVAVIPFKPAEWGAHSTITGVFFVASSFDVILRLLSDHRLAAYPDKMHQSSRSKLGRSRQLIGCVLVLPVIGLITGGLLLLCQKQIYLAFMLNAFAEIAFASCLMLFHATDYWLITTLELRVDVASLDMQAEKQTLGSALEAQV